MAITTEKECPVCGGAKMYDNRESKQNPTAPDFKCATAGCTGAIWPPRNGARKPAPATKAAPQGRDMGPYVPGLDEGDPGVYQQVVTQHAEPRGKATTIHSDDVKLLAECLEAGVRAVGYARKFLTPADDIVFTSDNVCSLSAILFIETRRSGR